MKRLLLPLLAVCLMFGAWPAAAYVGPGAGLSLLGALWAVIAAIGMSLMFVVMWPVRRLLRRRRNGRDKAPEEPSAVAASRKVGGSDR
jgi:hypothetical protein